MDSGYANAPSVSAQGMAEAGYALDRMAETKGMLRIPTVRERVVDRLEALKLQIKAHEEVLVALDAQPGVEKVLDVLRKIGI